MNKIGYARVSTDDQNLDLQRDALTKHGCAVIYDETVSGKNVERVELNHCLKALRGGDTLVVWRLDRLGRSLTDLVKIINDLEKRSVNFKSLSENIDTTTATGKLMFHMMSALAEFERNLTRERTKAGLASARARGKIGGRPKAFTDKQIREIKLLLTDPEARVSDIAARYGVAPNTIYRRVGVVRPVRPEPQNIT